MTASWTAPLARTVYLDALATERAATTDPSRLEQIDAELSATRALNDQAEQTTDAGDVPVAAAPATATSAVPATPAVPAPAVPAPAA